MLVSVIDVTGCLWVTWGLVSSVSASGVLFTTSMHTIITARYYYF